MTIQEFNLIGLPPQVNPAFARAMQRTLVPPIAFENSRLEAYGRTTPRDAVGGDLVDLVTSDGDVIAYVADASGHGVSAGMLMGMVKTAVRYGLMFGQRLPALLEGINSVLPSVKEPNMYATFAGLRMGGRGEVEYITAGNVPLLLYSQARRSVIRLSMEQFPLGMFPDVQYSSGCVTCAPGDVFAMLTDGLVETTDAWEEEFGLQRLEKVLWNFAGEPLVEIYNAAIEAVHRHGDPFDDRTLMLVRVLGLGAPSAGSRRSP
jgi:serine phosphatase RsbU (regulator of sigma subunit)